MQQVSRDLQDVQLLRVVATVLDPTFHYKTLACSGSTTSYDAICMLVKKYAIKMEDQSPQNFYLTEVCLNMVTELNGRCSFFNMHLTRHHLRRPRRMTRAAILGHLVRAT